MVEVSLKFNAKAFEKAVRAAPKLTRRSLAFRLEQIGDEFERRVDKRFTAKLSGPFQSNHTKGRLANRTGTLRATMAHRVREDGKDLTLRATIGDAATAHYVFTQEFGATIKPKRAKALTIPMPDNLTAAGRVRFKSARETEGVFLLKTPKGAFLVRKKASGEGLDFLWVLKKRVTIPARLGFRSTFEAKSMQAFARREIKEGINKVLAKVGLA